ncbi:MAG TPA: F0F1 ATP synthase subunit A [Thermomicrobiales bacterium]|nr:F0F1 ATP synthase subunit A [Thermomicrobiales bacterium]
MELHISLAAEALFHLGPIAVTNSMLVMFLVMAAILLVGSWLARKAQRDPHPGRAVGLAEMLVEFLLNLVESTAGKRIGRRIFPLIAGIFIFVLFANFTGLLPGVGTIYIKEDAEEVVSGEEATLETTEEHSEEEQVAGEAVAADEHAAEEEHHPVNVPLLRPPTADLNMTLAMSVLTFTVVQIAGVSAHGVRGRIKHMANPPFLFPIEVISELSRIISLSARLFGNVFAGEVLLGVMYAIAASIKIAVIPVLAPVVFLGLETLFGTIQALVFALLTLIYVFLAAAGHDDHDEQHVDEHDTVRPVEAQAHSSGSMPASAGD